MFELIDMVVVRPIVNVLFVIYSLVGDFGLAIILFTVLVKVVMWPLMKKQLRQTKMMRELQPEVAEIKKNCRGNRQMETMMTMDLYKRKNVKPFRSMLTTLIQLPIFVALFTAVKVMVTVPTAELSVEKSAYSFVEQLPRVQAVIADHASFRPMLFGVVDLSAVAGFASVSAVIVLGFALVAALMQYIVTRQQNPSKKSEKRSFKQIMKDAAGGKQADQSELNTVVAGQMSKFLPLMMLMFMIMMPGALVFYYMLTNVIMVVQQKIILDKNYSEMEAAADKKILKELREAEEAEIVSEAGGKGSDDAGSKGSGGGENKKSKVKITRITASNKKRRR